MDELSLEGLNPLADVESRKRAFKYFDHLKDSADGWQICVTALSSGQYEQNDHVKFFCFKVIEVYLKTRYNTATQAECDAVKNLLLSCIQKQVARSPPEKKFIKNKVALLLALVFIVDFPGRWPGFFSDLLSTLQLGEPCTDMYLRVMLAIDSEVVDRDIAHTEQEIERNTLLKDAIREHSIVQIVDSWYQIMTSFETSQPELTCLCLEVITAYISWIDINLIANQRFVDSLLRYMSKESLREAACECIHGIIIKGMDPHDKLKLIESFITVLSNVGIFNVTSDDDVDYLCKLSKLINGICLQLIVNWHKLSKSKDSVGCRLMLESLHTKMPLMLRFLSDEDDDVSAEMLKSAHDYISLMKICVPLTDQQQASVRELLGAVIKKMKYDEEYDFDREGEEEAEFLEYRKELKVIFNNIGALDKDLVLQTVECVIKGTLSDWRNKHICDVELAVTLIYHLAEAVPAIYKQYMAPDDKYNSTLHDILILMMSSGVLSHSHSAVSLQLFETFNRYDHLFSYEPSYVKDVLTALLDERGLWHPSPRVASRTAYLFSRFIKRINKGNLQSYVEVILTRLQALLELRTPPYTQTHTLSNEDQQFLYETVGILIVHSQFESQHKSSLIRQLLSPLLSKFEHIFGLLAACDPNHPQFEQQNETQQQYCECLVQAMALASRLSKGFSNQFTMQQCDCITVYTQCLQVFLNAFDAPTHRTMLHAGVRQFLHRMVVCMEQEILPFIPIALRHLLSTSQPGGEINGKELHDFIPLLNQLICKFKAHIVPFVHQTFPDVVSAVFNVLMQPVAENDRIANDDRQMLRRSYFSFIATIVNNNIPEVISKQEPATIEHVMMTIIQGAVEIPDANAQKACFSILKRLVELWVGKSEVAGFDDFVLNHIIPACFMAPMKPTFDLKDAQTCLVLNDAAACLKAISDKQTEPVANYLQTQYLPSLNVAPELIFEFCTALQSDHKVFKAYYKKFFLKAKT